MAELVASIIALAGTGAALARSLYSVADAVGPSSSSPPSGTSSSTSSSKDARLVAAEVALFSHSLSELTHHLGKPSSTAAAQRGGGLYETALVLYDACRRVLEELRAEIPDGGLFGGGGGGVGAAARRGSAATATSNKSSSSSSSSSSFPARMRWLFHKPKMRHLRLELESLKTVLVLLVAALNYDEASRSEAPLAITDPLREHVTTFLIAAEHAAARVMESGEALSSAAESEVHKDFQDVFNSGLPPTPLDAVADASEHRSASSTTGSAPPTESSEVPPPRTPMTPVSAAETTTTTTRNNAAVLYSPSWQSERVESRQGGSVATVYERLRRAGIVGPAVFAAAHPWSGMSAGRITAERLLGDGGSAFDALSDALKLRAQRMAYLFALDVLDARPPAHWTWDSVRHGGTSARNRKRSDARRFEEEHRDRRGSSVHRKPKPSGERNASLNPWNVEPRLEEGVVFGDDGRVPDERPAPSIHTDYQVSEDLSARLARLEELLATHVSSVRGEKGEGARSGGSMQEQSPLRADEEKEGFRNANEGSEAGVDQEKEISQVKKKESKESTKDMNTPPDPAPAESKSIVGRSEHLNIENTNHALNEEDAPVLKAESPKEETSPQERVRERFERSRWERKRNVAGDKRKVAEEQPNTVEEKQKQDQELEPRTYQPSSQSHPQQDQKQATPKSEEEDIDLHPGFRLPDLQGARIKRQAEVHKPSTRAASLDIPRRYHSSHTSARPALAPAPVSTEPVSPALSTSASVRAFSSPVMARSVYNRSHTSVSTEPVGAAPQRQPSSRPGKDWHHLKKKGVLPNADAR